MPQSKPSKLTNHPQLSIPPIPSSLICPKPEQSYDYMIKTIIIGDSGVGKTNIVSRYCGATDEEFKQCHVATIGVDFSTKYILQQNVRLKMQIWDTAGQQRFKNLTQTYYKGAAGIILVYSVDSEQSFKSIERWMEQVEARSPDDVVKVLVANKVDIEDQQDCEVCVEQARKVTTARGAALAGRFNIDYYETSARNNEGIELVFQELAQQIVQRIQQTTLVKNQAEEEVSMTISLNSHFLKQARKVKRQGIEYAIECKTKPKDKLRSKCTC